MIRRALHILLAGIIASPAAALTPLPPCAGHVMHGGYELWESLAAGEGFVTYHGQRASDKKMLMVLEHCKSGKAILVDTFWNDGADKPGNLDAATEVLDSYIESDRKFTLRQITRGLKRQGIAARQAKTTAESCACHVYFPEDRGNRKEFVF